MHADYLQIRQAYLAHFGTKGQRWGHRYHQSYETAPTRSGMVGVEHFQRNKFLTDAANGNYSNNLDKWGTNQNQNLLLITGHSGSGKSTLANKMADKNTDVINLDLFFEQVGKESKKERNKAFLSYLNKHFPNFEDMQDRTKAPRGSKQLGQMFDKFESCLEGFSREQYKKGRKVIAEGVQLKDDTLYPDKTKLRTKPMIAVGTGTVKSWFRAGVRDEKLLDFDGIDDIKEYIRWYSQSAKEVSSLVNAAGLQKNKRY